MAWHWENMKGAFLFDVCEGVSHCSAVHLSVVASSISILTISPLPAPAGMEMCTGEPKGSAWFLTSHFDSAEFTLTEEMVR